MRGIVVVEEDITKLNGIAAFLEEHVQKYVPVVLGRLDQLSEKDRAIAQVIIDLYQRKSQELREIGERKPIEYVLKSDLEEAMNNLK